MLRIIGVFALIFFAGLFSVNITLAETTISQDFDFSRGSQGSFGAMTDILIRIATTTPFNHYTRQGIGGFWADGNCSSGSGINLTFYDYGQGSSSVARATGSVTAGAGCVWEWSTTTPLCLNGCDIRIQSTGGTGITSNSTYWDNEVVIQVPDYSTSRSPWWNVYTIGVPLGAESGGENSTTTVFYPLGLNAIIDDMNCLTSATGTDCTFQYASTTNPVTPENLVLLALVFLGSFFLTYWLIKKLTS